MRNLVPVKAPLAPGTLAIDQSASKLEQPPRKIEVLAVGFYEIDAYRAFRAFDHQGAGTHSLTANCNGCGRR